MTQSIAQVTLELNLQQFTQFYFSFKGQFVRFGPYLACLLITLCASGCESLESPCSFSQGFNTFHKPFKLIPQ